MQWRHDWTQTILREGARGVGLRDDELRIKLRWQMGFSEPLSEVVELLYSSTVQ